MCILYTPAGADLQEGLNEVEYHRILDDQVGLHVLLLVDTFHHGDVRQQVNETNIRNLEAEVGLLVRKVCK